ncbi:MAG: cytochrome c [Chloroflexota bacterium]|nr:cytochrome c [Chloroflexota bacterium]
MAKQRKQLLVGVIIIGLLTAAIYLSSGSVVADNMGQTMSPKSSGMAILTTELQQAGREMQVQEDSLVQQGEDIYSSTCIACHQEDGEGVGPILPLAGNPLVTADRTQGLISVVLTGRGGMPRFAGYYSDQEIAAVLSYIRQAWENDADPVTAESVQAVRESILEPTDGEEEGEEDEESQQGEEEETVARPTPTARDEAAVADIVGDPSQFVDQTATVRADVAEVINERAFRLTADDEAIVVLTTRRLRRELEEGETLRVSGTVREFERAEIEEAIGAELPDDVAEELEGEPVIVASSIRAPR